MKIFISADIEGTAGIVHWDETSYGKNGYEYFRRQMTNEVKAACLGAAKGGAGEIVVKDAHDSARNILPDALPENVLLFRGWAKHPFSMMYGMDTSFTGVFLTGNHSAAGLINNPLSHTMNTRNSHVMLNGEPCPEALINSLTAAYLGVPVLLLTGDKGVCEWMRTKNPHIETVATNEGSGNGAMTIHPHLAEKRIQEAAERAVKKDLKACMFPMPEHFTLEITFKSHIDATSGSFYPGTIRKDATTLSFSSDDWMDVLKFIHFVF